MLNFFLFLFSIVIYYIFMCVKINILYKMYIIIKKKRDIIPFLIIIYMINIKILY